MLGIRQGTKKCMCGPAEEREWRSLPLIGAGGWHVRVYGASGKNGHIQHIAFVFSCVPICGFSDFWRAMVDLVSSLVAWAAVVWKMLKNRIWQRA